MKQFSVFRNKKKHTHTRNNTEFFDLAPIPIQFFHMHIYAHTYAHLYANWLAIRAGLY